MRYMLRAGTEGARWFWRAPSGHILCISAEPVEVDSHTASAATLAGDIVVVEREELASPTIPNDPVEDTVIDTDAGPVVRASRGRRRR